MADQLTIGLLGGTGPQGRGLALRLALAGHRVLLGSRDAERAAGIVADLVGGRDLPIEGVANPDAATGADVVRASTRWVPVSISRPTRMMFASEKRRSRRP